MIIAPSALEMTAETAKGSIENNVFPVLFRDFLYEIDDEVENAV